MRVLIRKSRYAAELIYRYIATTRTSRGRRPLFSEVETYCMFAGLSRTGHTIAAAVLDAHPEVVLAQELGILKHVRFGFKRDRLYDIILTNARYKASLGRRNKHYSYAVKDQWQGRFTKIRVIGDQQAEGVTRRLAEQPQLLQRLRDEVQVPIRVIFTVRNPFDNITTLAIRAAEQPYLRAVGFATDVAGCIDTYFELCESIMEIRKQLSAEEIIECRHESFVADPRGRLSDLCQRLHLEASDPYLDACAQIVNKSPHKTRHKREWTPEMKERVIRRMRDFPFLNGYSFED